MYDVNRKRLSMFCWLEILCITTILFSDDNCCIILYRVDAIIICVLHKKPSLSRQTGVAHCHQLCAYGRRLGNPSAYATTQLGVRARGHPPNYRHYYSQQRSPTSSTGLLSLPLRAVGRRGRTVKGPPRVVSTALVFVSPLLFLFLLLLLLIWSLPLLFVASIRYSDRHCDVFDVPCDRLAPSNDSASLHHFFGSVYYLIRSRQPRCARHRQKAGSMHCSWFGCYLPYPDKCLISSESCGFLLSSTCSRS
uniref:G_PROTEIN_RECEP_F1_2 domain-containing protein n=1 Tax=Steinernema glaseri TaxID=37863 RepID=A0A1I7ZJZ7_9BILA